MCAFSHESGHMFAIVSLRARRHCSWQIIERDPVGGGALVAKDFWSSQRSIRYARRSALPAALHLTVTAANACAPWMCLWLRVKPSEEVRRTRLLPSRSCRSRVLLLQASPSGALEN